MPVEKDPKRLFERWYVDPLRALKRVPNGDGGFVALAISCLLYERYAKSVLIEQGLEADTKGLVSQLVADFGLDEPAANTFWDSMRNGLLHAAMPKVRSRDSTAFVGWCLSARFVHPIELSVRENGEPVLNMEPWRFMDRVIELWEARPDLLNALQNSFPWGLITSY